MYYVSYGDFRESLINLGKDISKTAQQEVIDARRVNLEERGVLMVHRSDEG